MKILYNIIILVAFSLGMGACDLADNIDDIKPQNQQNKDNVMSDSASAEALLRNVYQQWRAGNMKDVRNHLFLSSGALVAPITSYFMSGTSFQSNNVPYDDGVIVGVYTSLYKVVNMANVVNELLEEGNAPDLSEKRTEEMIAECRFHRAMAHFYLLRYFGQFYDMTSSYGVVVREESYPDHQVATARSSVADVYTSIFKDLDYAIEKAPEYVSSDKHYYISRLVAKALKAKVLLNQGDYSMAETVAGDILRDAGRYGYSLENRYDDVFVNSYNSKEVFFALYAYGFEESFSAGDIVSNTTFGSYTEKIARLEGWPEEWGFDIETGYGYDERFGYVYRAEGPNMVGGSGEEEPSPWPEPEPEPEPEPLPDVYALTDDEMLPDGEGTMEPDGEGAPGWITPGVVKRNHKYPYRDMLDGEKGNTYFYLRLAEIYYIHAEAAARNNHFDPARNSLKEVLNFERAYVYPQEIEEVPDNEMLEYIRKNKWLELFAENNEEWFDMIRYHKAGDLNITDVKSTITSDRQFIFPIPKSALAGNNLLVQNP
ncbi:MULTISPECIES: RagB/SusD family nutrient uptake outer membrane protein [unclassified Butyricimonas]|uniref:RagB/SusD family nutrient uptake outer membrane protein n=1 Tax=unclassified Butyricimonas TaxID=2637652 RepID=UPI000C079E14|nr:MULTISPECIES: RagB/SusD family nutrient uptake outer membrane protein [unclassified Butyricimonas]